MNPRDLIQLQVHLEFQLDEQGLLVPHMGSSEQVYYLVYQHSEGYQVFFNQALSSSLRQELLSIGPQAAFERPSEVTRLVGQGHRPCTGGEEIYWSGYFSSKPDAGAFALVQSEGNSWSIIQDEQTICLAMSMRQDACCAEVYVETQPAYRKMGYGRQVVAAWASDILESGRVPFYSYRLSNSASAALARSLGVMWYANVVAFEPAAEKH